MLDEKPRMTTYDRGFCMVQGDHKANRRMSSNEGLSGHTKPRETTHLIRCAESW